MRKKLHAIMNTPDLPSGFTELEYLESNGAQWIDTLVYLSVESEVRATFRKTGGSLGYVFGSKTGWMKNDFSAFIQIGNTKLSCLFSTRGYDFMLDDTIHELTMNKYQITADGLILTPPASVPAIAAPGSCWLFSVSPVTDYQFIGKIYSFSISENGNLQRDFVPYLDVNNTPCMYDKVSGQCFYNNGTGTFGYKIKATGEVVAPKST